MADDDKLRGYLKRVTADLHDARRQLRAIEGREHEPIAIVGMACRYPGGVTSPEDLWRLVDEGADVISEFPDDRGWDDALYHPDPEHPGTSYTRHGGFLHDAGDFDPGFFAMSPREALSTDPQQRVFLEIAWEAFERAGIDPTSVRGSRTGVFAGVMYHDYFRSEMIGSVVSGRVAYTLDLTGPAVSVDTACSSSLVALHLATGSLRRGECSLALAGGVTVMSSPGTFIEFSRQRGLAPDGRCKSFGAGADGTGWAEGAGVLVLERLSDARRNGHQVLAVLRGSAVNQDGASNGLSAPNGPAQIRVIRQALADAGLSTSQVDLLEAHGTGTTLGDPIEAQALLATYGRERPGDRPLWLGSLKSNIGHTQAAAGVGGVIKSVMAMRHGVLPRSLHADQPSPHVDFAAGGVRLLTAARDWTRGDGPRRAGVSSFGFSGTNAHVILEEAPAPETATDTAADTAVTEQTPAALPVVPWLLSARSAGALRAQAERLLARLAEQNAPAEVVGAALATTRAVLDHRAVLTGTDRDELVAGLRALAGGTQPAGVSTGSGTPGKLAFLFTGQGSQRPGMGRELAESFPAFAEALDTVCRELDPRLPHPVRAVMFAEPGTDLAAELDETGLAQPALFAFEVALFRLAATFGLVPDMLAGHSIGELAAAHVAGVLSLADACRLVAARARLMQALPRGGAMLAVAAAEADVRPLLDGHAGVDVAAVNGPAAVVLSGTENEIGEIAALLAERGTRTKELRVSHAFHSPLMEPMLVEFRQVARSLTYHAPEIPMSGAVTDPEYWVAHVRETVRFADMVTDARAAGATVFVELGPDGVLSGLAEQTLEHAGEEATVVVPLVRKDRHEPRGLLDALGLLHTRGVRLDWHSYFAGVSPRDVELPTYAFQRQRYWFVPEAAQPAAEDAGFWAAVQREDTAALGIEDGSPLAGALPMLAAWHRRRHAASVLDAWRYRVGWQPLAPGTAAPELDGVWWLVTAAEDDDLGADVGNALAAYGAEVQLVALGDELDRHRIAATLREHAADEAPAGVLSLLATADSGAARTVSLLQALRDADVLAPVWLATQGAERVEDADAVPAPDQAAVCGLGRVFALEHPERWGGLIDLPATIDVRVFARLAAALTGIGDEDQVAVRDTGIFARRLNRAPRGTDTPDAWRPRDTALVVGGTGGLGGHVARWLAGCGAGHLVLTSRRGMDAPGAAELVAELEDAGARVTVAACDVADAGAVAALVAGVEADGAVIRSVFHTAGVPHLQALDLLERGEFTSTVRAKVTGARVLDELFAGRELDAFVLFSSGAGIWGSGNNAAYAAGNAFLDALAANRRARGLPGTAIAWGYWGDSGGGMTTLLDERDARRGGLPFMPADQAVAALAQALADDETHLVVADIDWEPFYALFASARSRPLVTGIPEVAAIIDAETQARTGTEDADSPLRARLLPLGARDRERLLVDLVREQVAAVLGHADTADVELDRPFRDLGFDSVSAVELRSRLHAATGARVPTTLIFDHPTIKAAAALLAEEILGAGDGPADTGTVAARADDPIVIVGMSCRTPGGVRSPEDLWRLVADGTDAISAMPEDRGWDLDAIYDPELSRPHTSYVREGGFLAAAGDFDAAFFEISPREAVAMDPQQRLLLELSWEAIERARIDPAALRGTRTGVFVGTAYEHYGRGSDQLTEEVIGHLMTGTLGSVASGRTAYTLGLEGPTLTVDTACSSSLVALHLATNALRNGECSLALAGGVTVMASPLGFVGFSRQGALSRDGRCKSFAAAADGFALAEGIGMVLLERLSDARRNGHEVLAVVRGSAVNSDGASNGLTAPNGPSQRRVIRQALADAGLRGSDVDALEAHGTGTTLGDPIEAQAVLATYGADRPADRPLLMGSIKSNLGHLQSAAGIVGVIKLVLAMRHAVLPRTLHVDGPSPHVDWSGGAVELLTEAQPWVEHGRARRAAVSSFGVSGTNAHVILEQPAAEAAEPAPAAVAVLPWQLSAATADGVAEQAARLLAFAGGGLDGDVGGDVGGDVDAAAIGAALVATRATLAHRGAVIGRDRAELLAGLRTLAAGETGPGVLRGTPAPAGRLALLFAGQGSQRPGMGRALAEVFPVFATALDEVCAVLDPLLPRPLREVMFAEPGSAAAGALDETGMTQPALFAFEVALYRLLSSYGVVPDVLVGHSIGEIAAAHVAGVFSLADAGTLIAARARLMAALPPGGAMLAVAAPEADVLPLLFAVADRVSLAAVNGPGSVVLSGAEDAVAEIAAELAEQGVRTKRLRVSHAFHSPLMDPMFDEFRQVAEALTYHEPAIEVIATGQLTDPGHWVRHVRDTVRFADGVATARDTGTSVYFELGPDGVLTGLARESLGETVPVVPAARRDRDEAAAFVEALAALHAAGVHVDWTVHFGQRSRHADLPTYAFSHQRYWLPSPGRSAGDVVTAGLGRPGHALLGAAVALAGEDGVVLTGRLAAGTHPWLAEHGIGGRVLVPGTAFAELAVRAGDEVGCTTVEELTLEAPLVLPERDGVRLQVTVKAAEDGRWDLTVHSRHEDAAADEPWTRHATGSLVADDAPAPTATGEWLPAAAERLDVSGAYDFFAGHGMHYGPTFRGLTAAWKHGGDLYAEVALPEGADVGRFGLHPALLDAALHVIAFGEQGDAGDTGPRVPFSFTGVRLHATGATALRVRLTGTGAGAFAVTATDAAGTPVADIGSLVLRQLSAGAAAGSAAPPDPMYTVRWDAIAVPPAAGDEPVFLGAGGLPALDAVPALVAVDLAAPAGSTDLAAAVRDATGRALELVQTWLARERFAAARLVLVTRGAVAVGTEPAPADLVNAATWGLIRSAQSENPGRFVLVDLDGEAASREVLAAALATGEAQLAVRAGAVHVPRLAVLGSGRDDALVPPPGNWRLDVSTRGTVDNLLLAPAADRGPLGPGEVRVAIRAIGLNFRDVLISLDMYPGDTPMGGEGAGVVTEVAADVDQLAPGDRVLGIFRSGSERSAVSTADRLVRFPEHWTFAEAASVPMVFATAYHALVDLAGLTAGESVLVHAAAGGVGMAAVQLARHLGAEVYGTAGPGKWDALRASGVAQSRIASSRTLEFEEAFRAESGGRGVDVVLNALAGDFIDASLRLLPRGGRFVEMGKTDLRDPGAVAAAHPGVGYQSFDLTALPGQRVAEILTEIMSLFDKGALSLLPIRTWDLRRARDAFRFIAKAQHIGKVVLTVPPALDPDGTVLITGGTGALGGLVARHLAGRHGMRHLVLTSRRGPAADGADALVDELTALGATVRVLACDVADRAALGEVLAGIPAAHPLTGIVHTAGVLDDGVLGSLDEDRLARVLRPKVDAAVHLHELTLDQDLAAFVLFSGAAGVLGNAGQGNYAAANTFLDALAGHRHAGGRAATSLAWGLWAQEAGTGITGHLGAAELGRLRRGGFGALSADQGLALFDVALAVDEPALVPIRVDLAAMRSAGGRLPELFRGLVRAPSRRALHGEPGGAASLLERLAGLPDRDRQPAVLELVRGHVATVLGFPNAEAVAPAQAFTEIGFDSLTSVEFRNRLNSATGLRLPATLVFDYPTPEVLARHMLAAIAPPERDPEEQLLAELDRIEAALAAAAAGALTPDRITQRLQQLSAGWRKQTRDEDPEATGQLDGADADAVLDYIDSQLGLA